MYAGKTCIRHYSSIQIFELGSGECIGSVVFPAPLTAVVMDAIEAYVFVGATSGDVWRVSLHDKVLMHAFLLLVDCLTCCSVW